MDSSVKFRSSIEAATAQSPVGAEILERIRGVRKGDAATVGPSTSDLTDIQEEIGNSVGHLADRRALGHSRLRQSAGLNGEALRRIADYYERLPDAPREAKLLDLVKRLEAFRDFLEGQDGEAGASTILELLRGVDGNARTQYMLLQMSLARFRLEGGEGNRKLVALLNLAERSFVDSGIAYDVRADLAVMAHLGDAVSLGVHPQGLRDKYRELLMSGMNLGQLFYALSDLSKRSNFQAVTDLILKAVGDDLSVMMTKADKSFLTALLKQLGILKLLRSATEAVGDLFENMRRMFPDHEPIANENSTHELMGLLLTFCTKSVPNMEDGRKMIKRFEGANSSPAASVVLCNGLVGLHRQMPDPAFPSFSARLQQADLLKEIATDLADLEEQANENQPS